VPATAFLPPPEQSASSRRPEFTANFLEIGGTVVYVASCEFRGVEEKGTGEKRLTARIYSFFLPLAVFLLFAVSWKKFTIPWLFCQIDLTKKPVCVNILDSPPFGDRQIPPSILIFLFDWLLFSYS